MRWQTLLITPPSLKGLLFCLILLVLDKDVKECYSVGIEEKGGVISRSEEIWIAG